MFVPFVLTCITFYILLAKRSGRNNDIENVSAIVYSNCFTEKRSNCITCNLRNYCILTFNWLFKQQFSCIYYFFGLT